MFRPRFPVLAVQMPKIPFIPLLVVLCALLCGLFSLKLLIVNTAAHHVKPVPPYMQNLPIATVPSGIYNRNVDASQASAIEAISIIQSIALCLLALILRTRKNLVGRIAWATIAITSIILAALAFFSPAMESDDLYAYIGQAEATPNAYHPGNTILPGDDAVINKIWGLPIVPSSYGPLWIVLSKAALRCPPSRQKRSPYDS
jgi:hypothetical protein